MKLTKRKLKQLIEAFIAGPKGTINLDADPYEYMKHHPDPKIAAVAKIGPQYAKQAAMLSSRDEDFENAEYEDEIRNDPVFSPTNFKRLAGQKVTPVYSRTMALYDSDPNFEANLKQRVYDYIGDPQLAAHELDEDYFQDGFFDIDGILEFEAEHFLERLAEEDARFDVFYTNHDDQIALKQKGRKSIEKIIEEAYDESGLAEALAQVYDTYDFGLP